MSDTTDTRTNLFGRIALLLACALMFCLTFGSYVEGWLGGGHRMLARVMLAESVLALLFTVAALVRSVRRAARVAGQDEEGRS